jgi:hypothetical protein
MKAPIAQAGGKAASPPGYTFFFLGPRYTKMNFKEHGFWLGPDLAILSRCFLLVPHKADRGTSPGVGL